MLLRVIAENVISLSSAPPEVSTIRASAGNSYKSHFQIWSRILTSVERFDMFVAFSSCCQHLGAWVGTGAACCQQPRFVPSCRSLPSVWDVKTMLVIGELDLVEGMLSCHRRAGSWRSPCHEKGVEWAEARTGCCNRSGFLLILTGTAEKNHPGEQQTVRFFVFINETRGLSEAVWGCTSHEAQCLSKRVKARGLQRAGNEMTCRAFMAFFKISVGRRGSGLCGGISFCQGDFC